MPNIWQTRPELRPWLYWRGASVGAALDALVCAAIFVFNLIWSSETATWRDLWGLLIGIVVVGWAFAEFEYHEIRGHRGSLFWEHVKATGIPGRVSGHWLSRVI